MKVYAVVIEHRHGDDLLVFDSYDKCRTHVAAYAREWWEDRAGRDWRADHTTLSDEEVIAAYFDDNEEEFFSIQECEVQ